MGIRIVAAGMLGHVSFNLLEKRADMVVTLQTDGPAKWFGSPVVVAHQKHVDVRLLEGSVSIVYGGSVATIARLIRKITSAIVVVVSPSADDDAEIRSLREHLESEQRSFHWCVIAPESFQEIEIVGKTIRTSSAGQALRNTGTAMAPVVEREAGPKHPTSVMPFPLHDPSVDPQYVPPSDALPTAPKAKAKTSKKFERDGVASPPPTDGDDV